MERSKFALVFSDHCKRNENILEYVKKQVQKHHLNCEMDSCKNPVLPKSSSSISVLVTATFDWLAKEVNICIKVGFYPSFIYLRRCLFPCIRCTHPCGVILMLGKWHAYSIIIIIYVPV